MVVPDIYVLGPHLFLLESFLIFIKMDFGVKDTIFPPACSVFFSCFILFPLFSLSSFECRASRLSLVVRVGVFFEGGLYIRIFGILPCFLLDKLKANKLKAREGMRHARARRTFDLDCAVPDSGGVAAGGGGPSRACRGSSSRLHARPQLQASTPTLECDGERGTGGDSRGGGVDSGQPGQILRPSGAASLTSISPVAVPGGEEEDEDWAWA